MHPHDLSQFFSFQIQVADLLQNFFRFVSEVQNKCIQSQFWQLRRRLETQPLSDTIFFYGKTCRVTFRAADNGKTFPIISISQILNPEMPWELSFEGLGVPLRWNAAEHETDVPCSTLKFQMEWRPRCLHRLSKKLLFPCYFLALLTRLLLHFQYGDV